MDVNGIGFNGRESQPASYYHWCGLTLRLILFWKLEHFTLFHIEICLCCLVCDLYLNKMYSLRVMDSVVMPLFSPTTSITQLVQ